MMFKSFELTPPRFPLSISSVHSSTDFPANQGAIWSDNHFNQTRQL